MPHFLYRITAPDGHAYIGVSKNPRNRLRGHRRDRASALYGLTDLRIEVLACGSREYIYELEDRAITVFKTRWPDGLNRSAGGYGGRTNPLPSTRAAMSAAAIAARKIKPVWNKGRAMPPEERAALAITMANSPLVLAAQAKATAAAAQKPVWNKGKPASAESRERMRVACLGRAPWNKGKIINVGQVPWKRKRETTRVLKRLGLY